MSWFIKKPEHDLREYILAIQSTSSSGSQIDVANIVSQLMQVEQKPLTALQSKIAKNDVKISSLGSFQGQLSAFHAALQSVQNTDLFSRKSVSNSAPASATASVASGSTLFTGRYKLDITRTAESAVVSVSGFSTGTHAIANPTAFRLTVAGVEYGPSASDNVNTVADLRDWINQRNGLKDKVRATLLQTDSTHWSLSLQGLDTGSTNSVTVTSPDYPASVVQQASDAAFTINGISFTRAGNTVSDAVPGLTLNLLSPSSSTVLEVTTDTSTTRPLIDQLASSYNDLLSTYKSLTRANANAELRGVLNSDSTLSSIMRQISSSMNLSPNGISELGLEFAKDGTLVVNETSFSNLKNLQQTLASGFKLGLKDGQDLSAIVSGFLSDTGTLASRIQTEKDNQTDLNRRKTQLEGKLALLQSRYTAQYAALDALLFKLNNTSTALKSALDALTNSQKNN